MHNNFNNCFFSYKKNVPGDSLPSPFPPSGLQHLPGGQTTPQFQQQHPQQGVGGGQQPPPPYPVGSVAVPPLSHLPPMNHLLLQQQLLQNPQFVQANANYSSLNGEYKQSILQQLVDLIFFLVSPLYNFP